EELMEEKQADGVSILLMNPQNGEIMAMVNVPEFDLNDPFTLNTGADASILTDEELQDALNQMWRNRCINDTYEPGSIFKIITSSACLEEGVVSLEDTFYCPGYGLWRTAESDVTRWEAMGRKPLFKGSRIPVTLCSWTSACVLDLTGSMSILKNSGCSA